ncbi:MAG: TonB C-terminal domain-containing protein [Candidatus Rokubacteria bacterium]|nr:TonB C-terminal domain-containing protein [Candidatus Rokubacteria bacterium]
MASIVLSTGVHVSLIAAVAVGAAVWRVNQPKTYIVNLVPAIAAVGLPEGRPAPTPLPPRAEDRAPRVTRSGPADLPARSRQSDIGLPDRSLPPRAPALPRPGEKESPAVASTPRPTVATPPAAAPAPARSEPVAPRPAALGRPSGSSQGAGALTLNVTDFPFAWYLQTIQRKITEKWAPPIRSGDSQQAVVVFEIGRDGQVRHPAIEKSSGDHFYDQAALRAITEANPFPPLPTEFKEPLLRVHLGFHYAGAGR